MADAAYCRNRAAEERRRAARSWLIIRREAHLRAAKVWEELARNMESLEDGSEGKAPE
jgi:hypothetical protein